MLSRCACVLLLVVGQAVSQCPEGCICLRRIGQAIFYMRCNDWGYTDLPEGNLKELSTINLSSNRITTLPNNVFFNRDVLNVEFLSLDDNSMSTIEEDAFRGLTKLEDLSLAKNNLSYLPRNVFSYSKNLSSLDLNENPHILLPADGFDLPQLKEISLKSCGLVSIPTNFFRQTPKLRVILLHNNYLTNFSSNLISSLFYLDTLTLHHNNFTSVQTELFKVLPKTLRIYFSNNPLQCQCNMFNDYMVYHARRFTQTLDCVSPLRMHIVIYFNDYCNKSVETEIEGSTRASMMVLEGSTSTTTTTVISDVETTTLAADPDIATTMSDGNTTEDSIESMVERHHWNTWVIAMLIMFSVLLILGVSFAFVKIIKRSRSVQPHHRLSALSDEETFIT